MAEDKNQTRPYGGSNLEIEPLSDEALDEVAGGSSNTCCSCSGCSAADQPALPAE
ncbi:MAG TPA: hypothetical protein VHG28_23095 [Longimicrobiaceae bacterium]|nr:hypothetical protein [Longimicrobiaceae bacterium]